MKYFFNSIFVFVFVVFICSLTVRAEGSWYDEWLDTYDERNPDNNSNYDSFKKDLMYYEGIVINSNNENQFMTSFANYVVTNVDDGSSYLSVIQSGVNAFKNGSLSAKGFVTFLNDVCSYSGINYQSLLKETASDLNNSKGYFLVPTLSLSSLNSAYLYNDEYSNFVRGYMADKNLCYVTLYKANNNKQYTSISPDLSNGYNFVFYPSNRTISQIESAYRSVVSQSKTDNAISVCSLYNSSGTSTSITTRNFTGGTSNVSYLWYGIEWSGARWYCLVNSNDSYAFVPFFTNAQNLTTYLTGNSPFYSSPLLKDLDVPDDFDYSRLQKIIDNSISNGDWVNSIDLQKIINDSVTDYLESININTKDILLSIQLGLIDNLNNEPYLKQIRDLQIVTNEKLDSLLELLRSGSSGSGGSLDLSETNAKLDTIISLLGIPDIDVDVDTPELNDFKLATLSKFPFCVPEDLYIIVSLIGVQPEKPDLIIDFPIMGQDESIPFEIDLSWFDEFRPYWYTFCDIGYLIFLLMISLKIIEGVKD